jgi:putative transposase
VVRELDALIARRGRPALIVSDKDTELTSRAVLQWTNRTSTRWALHRAWQAHPERDGRGRFRDECLNEEVFASLAEARAVLERWLERRRLDDNQVRRHSANRGLTSDAAHFWSAGRPAAQPRPVPPSARYHRTTEPL